MQAARLMVDIGVIMTVHQLQHFSWASEPELVVSKW